MGREELSQVSRWSLVEGHDGGPPTGLQDHAGRNGAVREVRAHIPVAEALAAWREAESGFTRLLAYLAQSLDCEGAVLWVPRGDQLTPRAFSETAAGDLREFKLMTFTSRLGRGVEVPGRAWQSLEPSGRSDPGGSRPPRWRAAAAAGFPGAIAFPAIWADEALAVIELVSREELELSERLKRSLAAIG